MNSRRKFLQASGFVAATALTAVPARAAGLDVPKFWQTRKLLILHSAEAGSAGESVPATSPATLIINTGKNIDALNAVQSEIVRRGDLKIGIITIAAAGLTGTKAVHAAAADLHANGCDLVICSSTLGFRGGKISDELLARESQHLDLILSSKNAEPITPRVVLNAEDREVLIDNAGGANQSFAGLEIRFNASRKKNYIAFSQA